MDDQIDGKTVSSALQAWQMLVPSVTSGILVTLNPAIKPPGSRSHRRHCTRNNRLAQLRTKLIGWISTANKRLIYDFGSWCVAWNWKSSFVVNSWKSRTRIDFEGIWYPGSVRLMERITRTNRPTKPAESNCWCRYVYELQWLINPWHVPLLFDLYRVNAFFFSFLTCTTSSHWSLWVRLRLVEFQLWSWIALFSSNLQ